MRSKKVFFWDQKSKKIIPTNPPNQYQKNNVKPHIQKITVNSSFLSLKKESMQARPQAGINKARGKPENKARGVARKSPP